MEDPETAGFVLVPASGASACGEAQEASKTKGRRRINVLMIVPMTLYGALRVAFDPGYAPD